MTMTDQLPANKSNSPFKQAIVGGYDRDEVDEYVAHLERRIEQLEQDRTPDGAVQRALGQVGDEVAGILQQAHETADQLTESARTEANQLQESSRRQAEQLQESSQREAQERLETARREADERIGASHRDAAEITANAQTRLQELDVDADRIWGERERILTDIRFLAQQLTDAVDGAGERFPADEAGEATDEVAMLPGELGLVPEEAAEAETDDATQAFDVEELFAEEELPGDPAQESSPEVGEDPELAGD
jgi:cell division septum initiation protein DivIVA